MTKASSGVSWEWKQCYLFFALLIFSAAVSGKERIALVIGNSNYEEISPLTNPRNDADDVAERLRSLDFKLHGDKVHHDLNERSLLRLTSRFSRTADGAEIALLYFAGHGMQFNGDPHLLPVDIPDDSLDVVQSEAVGLNRLLANLAGKAELTVAIFDACREIPDYRMQIKRATRGGSDAAWRGLSRPKVQVESTLIAYSGGSGELVADGDGRNSPYTQLLLENLSQETIRIKQLDVPDLFEEVSYQFRIKHDGQRPEVINQGVRPNHYYLLNVPVESISADSPDKGDTSTSADYLLWKIVDGGKSIAEYRAYLDRFPDGLFSGIARARIADLRLLGIDTEADSLRSEIGAEKDESSSAPVRLENKSATGRLTVEVEPNDARIRIMNIGLKYRAGIELEMNKVYDVLVTREGYNPWRRSVRLFDSEQLVVVQLEEQDANLGDSGKRESAVVQTPPSTGHFSVSGLPDNGRFCVYLNEAWNCDGNPELVVGEEYSLFASAPGYDDWHRLSRLERPGQPISLSLTTSRNYVVRLELECNEKERATSCFRLGQLYSTGIGVAKNPSIGVVHQSRACEGDKLEACLLLKHMAKERGESWKPDGRIDRLVRISEQRCEKGNIEACYAFGMAILEQDLTRGISVLTGACDNDFSDACLMVAAVHELANGGVSTENSENYMGKYQDLSDKNCDSGDLFACAMLSATYGALELEELQMKYEEIACKGGFFEFCGGK